MPKKYHMRKRSLKGGDTIGQSFSNLGNSIASGASSIWNKTKKLVGIDNSGSTYAPSTGSSNYAASNTLPLSSNSSYKYGGKRRGRGRKTKRFRKMKRGGSSYVSNSSLTNLASSAAPFSGVTAKVAYVGGRRKKTRRSRH
jgi:hypothetical protein